VSEYSNEGDAIQGRPKKNENKLAWTFTFTVNVIDDVMPLNNAEFGESLTNCFNIFLA
jgi:hypothetical protein